MGLHQSVQATLGLGFSLEAITISTNQSGKLLGGGWWGSGNCLGWGRGGGGIFC